MVRASATNADIAHEEPWRDAGNYSFVSTLPPAGCPREFLHRNPDYQKTWCSLSSQTDLLLEEDCGAAVWAVVRFELPEHKRSQTDGRGARAAAARSRLTVRRTALS